MLNIQRELKNGKTPEEICTPLGINFKELDGKVIFTYDLIDSYKYKSDPIVKECRGLILYKDNWDVACYPFDRFFNYGETGADKLPDDLEGCQILEKLDGTMVSLWWDRVRNKYQASTRSMVYAEGPVNNCINKTFSELFWVAALETDVPAITNDTYLNDFYKDFTLVFELCGPENRIVTPYKETFITLLTIRNNITLNEVTRHELCRLALDIQCPIVKAIGFRNWQQLLKMEVESVFEGYVVLKENFNGEPNLRVKVKNPAYLEIHKMATSISERGFLEIIKLNKQDDYLSYFPEHAEHINKLLNGLKKVKDTVIDDWKEWTSSKHNFQQIFDDFLNIGELSYNAIKKQRGRFAQFAIKRKFPSMLFQLYDGKIQSSDLKLLELRTDNLLEMIKHA